MLKKTCLVFTALITFFMAPHFASADLNIAILSVSPASQVIGYSGGTLSFEIYNMGGGTLNWTITVPNEAKKWITIPNSSGTGDALVSVQVAEYDGTEAQRTATLTVEAQGAFSSPRTITITQYNSEYPVMQVDLPFIMAAAKGNTGTIHVDNKGLTSTLFDFEAVVTDGKEWVQVTKETSEETGQSYIKYTVVPTNTKDVRTGQITVTAIKVTDVDGNPLDTAIVGSPLVIPVRQSGSDHTLVVDPKSLELSSASQTADIKVSFETELPIVMYPWAAVVTQGKEWLSIPNGGGSLGNGKFTISVTGNNSTTARKGSITVTSDGAAGSPITLTVSQKGVNQSNLIGSEPGIITKEVGKNEEVSLAINSTNKHGHTPKLEWFLITFIQKDYVSPVFLVTKLGMVDSSSVLDHLSNYCYTFDKTGVTVIGTLKLSDLGFQEGDTMIYAYAYTNDQDQMVIDNIVTLHVTK